MITDQTFWDLTRKPMLTALEKRRMDLYQRKYKAARLKALKAQFILPDFPNAGIASCWALGHPYATHTFGRLDGLLGQSDLRGSVYDYPLTKHTRLIHYTSADVLAKILDEGAFRAFSLSNSTDEQEFICKASEMGCADWNLAKWRDNLFSVSFVDLTRHGESAWHWENYGCAGKGAGIVVSIDPRHRYKWVEYFLGPIFYDGEEQTRYAKIKEDLLAFEKEHVFRWDRPEDYFAKLFAFHKVSTFKHESEVRLLTHWPHRSGTGRGGAYTERKDLVKYTKPTFEATYSVPIYLGARQEEHLRRPSDPELEAQIKHLGPQLKIEEVVAGPDVSETEFNSLQVQCRAFALQKIGYEIPVRWSEHRKGGPQRRLTLEA